MLFYLLLCLTPFLYAQNNTKTWLETSVKDFSDNELENLIISDISGGEVQFPHPFIKIVDDYKDNSFMRSIVQDSAGNFLRTWVTGGNVFVKKYNADGDELTQNIQVNKQTGDDNTFSKAALLNNGIYLIIWNQRDTCKGQFFTDDSVKTGDIFIIEDIRSMYPSEVLADNNENTFLLFFTNKVEEDYYKLYAQTIDTIGNKVGDGKLLNLDVLTTFDDNPVAEGDANGFWLSWGGSRGGIYDRNFNVHLRRFDYDLNPQSEAIIVNDDFSRFQSGADLCIDKNSNIFCVWMDDRDAVEPVLTGQYNIYGQLLDANGNKIGENVKINSILERSENRSPYIYFKNDKYFISWQHWSEKQRFYETYVNIWEFDPKLTGEMISSIFYGSPEGNNWENISWELTNIAGSNIKFKIRSGKSVKQLTEKNWLGPDDESGYYTINTGELINPVHSGDDFIQYKAIFNSSNGSTSILQSVSISFSSSDNVPPQPPASLSAEPSHAKVILLWQPAGEEISGYKIYKGTESGVYNQRWNIFLPSEITSYEDTNITAGIEYFYAITAMDSSYNESQFSEEVNCIVYGINIYVNENSLPNGDGSILYPFITIEDGISNSFFGDTIRVLPGYYNDISGLKEGVSLIGTSAEKCEIGITLEIPDKVLIKGFTFTRSIICSNYSNPVITENHFRGTGDYYMPAISIGYSSSPTITKNVINDCRTAIRIDRESNPIIKNNIMRAYEVGIRITAETEFILINNTIIGENAGALWGSFNYQNKSRIENNILVASNTNISGYLFDNTLDQDIISYNNFWNEYFEGIEVIETNQFLDPHFVDMSMNDFQLLPESPCIDNGNPDPDFNDTDGTRNDMGAYGGPDPIITELPSRISRSMSVSGLSGFPGDTVDVYIKMDDPSGLAKADFSFKYDNTILTFIEAELTEATRNFSLSQQMKKSGEIIIGLISEISAPPNLTEILKLRFIVNKNTNHEDASPLLLQDVNLSDVNFNDIYMLNISSGVFVVSNIKYNENYIYVDCNYQGTENGSMKKPFNTIMEAVNVSNAGDSIFVSGGNYYENIIMKEGLSLIGSGAAVTILNKTGENAVLTFENIINSEIQGFTFRIGDDQFTDPLIYCLESSPEIKKNKFESEVPFGSAAILCLSNSNALIEDNYFKELCIEIGESHPTVKSNVIECGYGTTGIYCAEGSASLLSRNLIKGIGGTPSVTINSANPRIENNLIYCDHAGFGLFITNAEGTGIQNNIIVDISNSGTGINIVSSSSTSIINNTIATSGKGIEEFNSTSVVLNNIVINNNNFGVQLSPQTFYDYNNIWNNENNYNEIEPGANDISSDPIFSDASAEDFRLSPYSPCINAGNPGEEYNDKDGTRNDIGAYGGPGVDLDWISSNSSSLTISQSQSSVSDTVEIAISGENLYGITNIDLTLSYDPSVLKIVNINSSEVTKNFTVSRTVFNEGTVKLILNSNHAINSEKGDLSRLYFAIETDQKTSTFIRFDSAKVKNESDYEREIFELKDCDIQINPTAVEEVNDLPADYKLFQNYPNPFNPETKIKYELPKDTEVKLVIHNLLGERVTTLVNSFQKAGSYERVWNAGNYYASGVYFYQVIFRSGKGTVKVYSKKMILIK
ncbi:MAG: right-handed parallel beta-helix repeat-containing protein [Melioribacteraceae bacterium]|nr:right-handed parallel beta-helix repeat-containing protein [Melioribacteraceae bacterium]